MAAKKCPKCGEDNPAEAVMCWACYTPLSGGPMIAAGAGGATARGPIGAPVGRGPAPPGAVVEEEQKKKIDPKIIGVGAFLIVAGIIGFMIQSSMGGSPSAETDTSVVAPPVDPGVAAQAPLAVNAPPPVLSSGGGGVGAAPPPLPAQFTTVVPPNPEFATGTVGIMATGNNTSPQRAAGLARFAKNQFSRGGRWTNMQICVFSNQRSADAFREYQNKRRGKPLSAADYQALGDVWSGTPAYLESIGKSETVYNPSGNPGSWWPRR